jgi:hypothetical protein
LGSAVAAPQFVDPVEELRRIEAEFQRRRHLDEPDVWVRERLSETIWSGQQAVLSSLGSHRRTAVKSCHEIGKSFIAARAIGWWIDTHPLGEAFVVTTAPTAPQVEAILWREFGRVHSKGKLAGRLNQTEWWINTIGKDELIAFGRKPADTDPTAFQGIHAPYVLFVGDEACGLPKAILEAADSLIANDNSKSLLIGNPDDPFSHFAELCKAGSDYNVIEIGAFDTPNFTGEALPKTVLDQLIGRTYVEEKRKQWAPNWRWVDRFGQPSDPRRGVRVVPPPDADPQDTDPYWQSKILGKFPKTSGVQALIPEVWIRAAQERSLDAHGDNRLGVDVGGGGDSSTGVHRRGYVARVLWEDHNPDTMQTCGNAIHHAQRIGADAVLVDSIGIGRGVADRGKELDQPFTAVNVGEGARGEDTDGKPFSDHFVNYRAQLWWSVRSVFESGEIDIDPQDQQLAKELANLRFKRTSSGKIQIESKEDMKKRGQPSPNRADGLMLTFAEPEEQNNSVVW